MILDIVIQAHGLASLGATLGSGQISVRDDMPSCIEVLVAKDLVRFDE